MLFVKVTSINNTIVCIVHILWQLIHVVASWEPAGSGYVSYSFWAVCDMGIFLEDAVASRDEGDDCADAEII